MELKKTAFKSFIQKTRDNQLKIKYKKINPK